MYAQRLRHFLVLVSFALAIGKESSPEACYDTPVYDEDSPLQVGDQVLLAKAQLCDYYESSSGISNIERLDIDSFVSFDISLSTGGVFDMEVEVSSPEGDGAFELRNWETDEVFKVVRSIHRTGGWDEWRTLSLGAMELHKGHSILRLTSLESGWNFRWIKLTLLAPATPEGLTRFYSSFVYPENDFMVRAHDMAVPEGVVVSPIDSVDSSLTFLTSGDMLKLEMDVGKEGLYRLFVCVSNPSSLGSFVILNEEDFSLYAEVETVPPTEAWDEWIVMEVGNVNFNEGSNLVNMIILEGGFDVMFVGADYIGPTSADGNKGIYLPVGADEANLSASQGIASDGNMLTDLDAGDYIVFDLDVPKAGEYTIEAMVVSSTGDGEFSFYDGSTNALLGASTTIFITPNWWIGRPASVPVTGIRLPKGPFQLKLLIEKAGFSLDSLVFRMD